VDAAGLARGEMSEDSLDQKYADKEERSALAAGQSANRNAIV